MSKNDSQKVKKIEVIESHNTDSAKKVITPEIVEKKFPATKKTGNDHLAHSNKELATTDAISKYLNEIRKYPLLTKEEEFEIAVQYRETGDPELAQKLITSNLRFVVKIAAEYSKFGSKLIDLIQEGNVGLMQALKEYNPYKGVRLVTYAVWWIRGHIQEYLMRQYSLVRIGTTQNQKKLFYQLQKQKQELEKLGLEGTVKQLSGRLNVPEKDVKMMSERMFAKDISLDQPLSSSENGTSLLDFQADQDYDLEEELSHQEQIKLLVDKIDQIRPSLKERELELLDQRILADEPITLQEIGEKYNISREAVRQMEVRVLNKIKKLFEEEEA